MKGRAYDYGRIAWCYDELAALYSLGRIERSKRAFLSRVEAGDRVILAGVGRGGDALAAARIGARVTAVDVSERMLARLGQAATREGLEIDCVRADAASFESPRQWDHVVAHYFLNCFSAEDALRWIALLAGWVRPGGLLHLADFAPIEGGRGARFLGALYYRIVNVSGWILGLCALHPVPDLVRITTGVGFEVEAVTRFPLGARYLPAFQAVSARAPQDDPDGHVAI